MEKATLAGGCFWCMEAVFTRVRGVLQVVSGYSGGHVKDPSYNAVSEGTTGHAEAIQITFDPQRISYSDLLRIFFHLHDPTTGNRQDPDIGEQYRSVIFYHNPTQKRLAVKAREEAQKGYEDPIVTQIEEFEVFYPAERYHKDYYANNPDLPYCRVVIDPKIKKLLQEFPEYVQ